MSKWKNLQTGDIFDSYDAAYDDIFDNLSPLDIICSIFEDTEEEDLIAALNGKTPDFYTNSLMEFARKQFDEYIVKIPEEENTEEN